MGFTNAEQLWEVFLSGGMGFLLGGYYDVFRIWRKMSHSSTLSVFFQDCFFFVTSAVVLFLFSLSMTDGVVRAYVVAGAVAGFVAYRHTVGNILLHAVSLVLRWLSRGKAWLCGILLVPFSWLKTHLGCACGKVWKKCRKTAKKSKEILKKGLQPVRKLLYNRTV